MSENAGGKQEGLGGPRKFQKGQSGNPAGKAPGTRNTTTLAIEKLLDGEAKAITRKAIDMALAGDSIALRLVMERVAPVRRGRPVQFELPTIDKASDLVAALGGILKATSSGALTPEEAATIATILETKRKAIETVELEQRLAAIEKATAR